MNIPLGEDEGESPKSDFPDWSLILSSARDFPDFPSELSDEAVEEFSGKFLQVIMVLFIWSPCAEESAQLLPKFVPLLETIENREWLPERIIAHLSSKSIILSYWNFGDWISFEFDSETALSLRRVVLSCLSRVKVKAQNLCGTLIRDLESQDWRRFNTICDVIWSDTRLEWMFLEEFFQTCRRRAVQNHHFWNDSMTCVNPNLPEDWNAFESLDSLRSQISKNLRQALPE